MTSCVDFSILKTWSRSQRNMQGRINIGQSIPPRSPVDDYLDETDAGRDPRRRLQQSGAPLTLPHSQTAIQWEGFPRRTLRSRSGDAVGGSSRGQVDMIFVSLCASVCHRPCMCVLSGTRQTSRQRTTTACLAAVGRGRPLRPGRRHRRRLASR